MAYQGPSSTEVSPFHGGTQHNGYHYILGGRSDLGWCSWPTMYSTWTPTTISFSFSISLIIAQFTIFSNFWSPEIFEPFWGPEQRFYLGIFIWEIWLKSCFQLYSLERSSNEVSCVSNEDSMTKLRSREVGYPTNPHGAHKLLVLNLLGLGFWLFRVFSYCSIIKRPLGLIVTKFRGM